MKKRLDSRLSRRRFLGGAGVALTLPFLPSVAKRGVRAQTGSAPKRAVFWYVPNGIVMDAWTPVGGTEESFELPQILTPLASVREHVNILSGIHNLPARPDGPGDHAAGTGSFLTATHVYKTEGADYFNGESVDQTAAKIVGLETPISSLQLGMEGGGTSGGCDSGYTCAYTRNISWRLSEGAAPGETAHPVAKQIRPHLVFDNLFAGLDPEATMAERLRRQRYQTSILDYTLEEANSLHGRLNPRDRRRLDQYLTGVREVERRIAGLGSAPMCSVPERPSTTLDWDSRVRTMADLQVLAFQCDLTRIATFMIANAGTGRRYTFLPGVTLDHHIGLSHDPNTADHTDQLITIDTWEVDCFAHMLRRMAETEDEEGSSLLDNSVAFFSSEVEDGNAHRHTNLPILVAGGAGGRFRTGRHIRYEGGPPIANLFMSILHALDVEVDSFGEDSTGLLDRLT